MSIFHQPARFQHLIYLAVFIFIILSCITFSNQQHSLSKSASKLPLLHPSNVSDRSSQTVNEKIVLWSSDFHISPIADIKSFLRLHFPQENIEIIDKSLSGHCHLTHTCQRDLQVLNRENGITLGSCPNELRRSFYRRYREDAEFLSVDAFVCTHATSLCEVFMPFDKPMILIASTRYEIGRHDERRWRQWNENLVRIAGKNFNVIAANNLYDLEYVKYFTGLRQVQYLPNLCEYVNTYYDDVRGGGGGDGVLRRSEEVLLAPARGIDPSLLDSFSRHFHHYLSTSKKSLSIRKIRDLYPHYEYADVSQHRAVVVLPYQVSFMTFFEFYRMAVPMFVPSPSLLATWHHRHQTLSERTWHYVFTKEVTSSSAIPRAQNSTSRLTSDPNDDSSYEAILQWVTLSDLYSFPHIQQFTSWQHLFDQLTSHDTRSLREISSLMSEHNKRLEAEQVEKWRHIIDKIKEHKNERRKKADTAYPPDMNEALKRAYGYQLSHSDCVSEV